MDICHFGSVNLNIISSCSFFFFFILSPLVNLLVENKTINVKSPDLSLNFALYRI